MTAPAREDGLLFGRITERELDIAETIFRHAVSAVLLTAAATHTTLGDVSPVLFRHYHQRVADIILGDDPSRSAFARAWSRGQIRKKLEEALRS